MLGRVQMHDHPQRVATMTELLFVLNIAAVPLFTIAIALFLAVTDPTVEAVFGPAG